MKKIKTNTPLLDRKGEPLKEGDEPITIGLVISNVLFGQVSNPHRGYQLGRKFAGEKDVELRAEDIVYIKEQLEKAGLHAIIIGQAIEILESGE